MKKFFSFEDCNTIKILNNEMSNFKLLLVKWYNS